MSSSKFPPAFPHGSLHEVLPDIFWVRGSVGLKRPPLRFSRNMLVLRQGEALTLVNTLRLDDAGLAALDALGKVEHVIRLAGFHGMDDAFYKDRYGARVWAVEGQVYAKGFDNTKVDAAQGYFQADEAMTEDTELPIEGAKLIRIAGATPEGILHLDRDGGVLVTGDALQNWDRPDEQFNFLGGLMMRFMGFIRPLNVGPGWLKEAKPSPDDLAKLLELDFDKVLPCHGSVVLSGAKQAFRPAIERSVAKLRAG